MADKSFGIKQLNLIGASGTPTITSPNNLNLNASTVAISTDVTISRHLDVDGHTELDNVNISGIVTAFDLDVDGHTELDNVNVSGVSTFVGLTTFKNYVTITELGNSNYDGIRFVSGSNFAIVQSDSLGNLTIGSQSTNNRYVEINGYSQFFANSGDVQLNNGNQGTTKVGSAITFTSNTGEISTFGDVKVGVDTSTGVILTSPNGSQYRLVVDDSGNLTTTLT